MKYTTVLFDFDYTLGDGTEGIVDSFCYAFRGMGLPEPGREPVRHTVGLSLEEAYAVLTGDGSTAHAARFVELYRERANEVLLERTVLLPYAEEILCRLHCAGIKTGIVTNKFRFRLDQVLEKFALPRYVDVAVGADEAGEPKPSPKSVWLAIERAGGSAEQTLYVGDSLVDAQTAQNAGLAFAAVTNGTTRAEEFAAYPHTLIARDLAALLLMLHI